MIPTTEVTKSVLAGVKPAGALFLVIIGVLPYPCNNFHANYSEISRTLPHSIGVFFGLIDHPTGLGDHRFVYIGGSDGIGR